MTTDNTKHGQNRLSNNRPPYTGKSGENGEMEAHTRNGIMVCGGAVDQRKRPWVRIRRGTDIAYISATDICNGQHEKCREQLRAQNIAVVSPQTLIRISREAEKLTFSDKILVADRQGWNGQSYVLGDGTIFQPKDCKDEIVVAFAPNSKHSVSCTVEQYWSVFAPLAKKQEFLLFAIMIALIGPLLGVIRRSGSVLDNIFFDICGPTSNGKSTVYILLAGSLWGFGSPRIGFGESWNMTLGGLAKTVPRYNDGALFLDEANAVTGDERTKGQFFRDGIFIVSGGDYRNTAVNEYTQEPATVACISSSNVPLGGYFQNDGAVGAAFDVRCITIRIPEKNRPHKIFTEVPKGFKDSGTLAQHISSQVQRYHGAPIRKFLQALVAARNADENKLIADITEYQEEFLNRIDVDKNNGPELRRANAVGLAYAAGRLARKWDALPKKEEIGSLLTACENVWNTAIAVKTTKAAKISDPLVNYIESNVTQFVTVKDPIPVNDKRFNACPGYIKRQSDGTRELIVSSLAFKRIGLRTTEISTLRKKGILLNDGDRLSCKRTVRLVDDSPKSERVKVFDLTALKVKIKGGKVIYLK
jgi:Domain of unknown function (DUF927)